jgi:uncharacterized protein (TIGR00645 family)
MQSSEAPEATSPSAVDVVIGRIILVSRYVLLVPFYLALMWAVVLLMKDFGLLLFGRMDRQMLVEHTIHTLELVDVTMIANLVWFIAAGSYYVFVAPYPFAVKNRPRCLTNVSAGLLKEKTTSSIVSIASIYLLTAFFEVISGKGEIDWVRYAIVLGIYVSLLLTLLTFCKVESAPHHAASKDH